MADLLMKLYLYAYILDIDNIIGHPHFFANIGSRIGIASKHHLSGRNGSVINEKRDGRGGGRARRGDMG